MELCQYAKAGLRATIAMAVETKPLPHDPARAMPNAAMANAALAVAASSVGIEYTTACQVFPGRLRVLQSSWQIRPIGT